MNMLQERFEPDPISSVAVLDGELAPCLDRPLAGAPMDRVGRIVTVLILFGPFVGVIAAAAALFGAPSLLDLLLGVVLYAVAGHGLTAGYHRMCTHRAFHATRATKIALIASGSLGFEGGPLGWSANHRRHHMYTDVDGDPHSPHLHGDSLADRLRGACYAHVGWLFGPQLGDYERRIPDLIADRDLVLIDKLFPYFCLASLAIPTLIGWGATGTAKGAFSALVWAGFVRIFILQHATFAVNSACHLWGKQPFRTRPADRSRNFAPLAILAMGENWHNLHHSLPRLAQHGVGPHEWDSTSRLIRILERAQLVSEVRWPDPASLDARRNSLR